MPPKTEAQTNQEAQDAAAADAVAKAERDAAEAAAKAQADADAAAQADADKLKVAKTAADKEADELKAKQDAAAAAAAAQQASADKAAKEAAAKTAVDSVPAGHVQVTITTLGAKEGVYTGQDRCPETGDAFPTYPKGARPVFHLKIAEALRDKGYADFDD